MTDLTPREIVSELDRFIIGQKDAKRAVAVALRNRWRRKQLGDDLRDEVYPKNILMIGPTGVGKTEISRRLAKLAKAPFLKVEATKFTEVGYVGRDVEQIIRDLVDSAIVMIREMKRDEVKANAHGAAEDRVLDALTGPDSREQTREMFRKKLREGLLDDKEIELDVADTSNPMQMFEIPGQPGNNAGMMNLGDIFGKAFSGRTTRRILSGQCIVGFRQNPNKVLFRQRPQLHPNGQPPLQLGQQIARLGDVERARGDKQDMVGFHRSMFGGNRCPFNQRQQIPLHTLTADIRPPRIGPRTNLVDLIQENDPILLNR